MGSDIHVACVCVAGTKVYWMLDKEYLNQSLSKAVNASYTVLTLKNFTRRSAIVECLREDHQVLAGTFIRTYCEYMQGVTGWLWHRMVEGSFCPCSLVLTFKLCNTGSEYIMVHPHMGFNTEWLTWPWPCDLRFLSKLRTFATFLGVQYTSHSICLSQGQKRSQILR